MSERRRHPRNSIAFPVTLVMGGAPSPVPGLCKDISLGGVYVATEARPAPGQPLRMIATLPGSTEPVTIFVSVRWTGHDGVGLQFDSLGDKERNAVLTALRLAMPKPSIPPGARRRRAVVLASALLSGLLVSVGLGFGAVRYGPALLSRLQGPANETARPSLSAPASPALPTLSSLARGEPTPPPSFAPVPAPSVSASDGTTALSAHAAPPVPAADASSCMVAMFPADAFKSAPDLGFVCTEPDPRKAAARLRVKLVIGSGGRLTAATNEWSRLGWYELAVLGALRQACCPAPATFTLPAAPASCASLPERINALGAAVKSRSGVAEARKAFEDAAVCLHAARTGDFHYPTGPFGGGQIAFDGFLARNVR
jgi:hypothetical protein